MKILLIIAILNGPFYTAKFDTIEECKAEGVYQVLVLGPENIQHAWCQPID